MGNKKYIRISSKDNKKTYDKIKNMNFDEIVNEFESEIKPLVNNYKTFEEIELAYLIARELKEK